MADESRLHAALGAVGLLSWALYLLACGWTSWGPDGRKILVLDKGTDDVSALIVDVRSGRAKQVAAISPIDGTYAFAQWDRSGKRVIVGSRKDPLSVLVVPADAPGPVRHFWLEVKGGDDDSVPIPPLPQIGNDLYLACGRLHRLDLETGATASKDLPKGTRGLVLFQSGERVGYVAFPRDDGPLAVGEVDRTDLSLRPAFELRADQLRPGGAKLDLQPFVAVDPSGGRIAIPATSEDGRDAIVLLASKGLERVFVPRLPEGYRLGNLQWSRDGKALHAATLGPTREAGVVQYSAAVIPLANEPPRSIPLARLRATSEDGTLPGDWSAELQVSLSPDGKSLATRTGHLGDHLERIDGAAIYILDLRNDAVRKIPLPARPRGGESGKKNPP